jgi:hypothetical protein
MGDVRGAALDLVRRSAQFDQPGGIDFSQREFTEEVLPPFRIELRRNSEQALGANLAPTSLLPGRGKKVDSGLAARD